VTDNSDYTQAVDDSLAHMQEVLRAVSEATSAITTEVMKMDGAYKWEPLPWDKQGSQFSLDNQINVLDANNVVIFAGTGAEFIAFRQQQDEEGS
jgi:hypothetical protein